MTEKRTERGEEVVVLGVRRAVILASDCFSSVLSGFYKLQCKVKRNSVVKAKLATFFGWDRRLVFDLSDIREIEKYQLRFPIR